MGIETTATYDAATQEFVIHTPSNEASKAWIGGTGQHGKLTIVFAQLYTQVRGSALACSAPAPAPAVALLSTLLEP